MEARSPQRAPSPDSLAAGRPMSPDAVSRGMSSQVMGLEGLMYGSPTYVRPSRCGRAPGTLLYCQELGLADGMTAEGQRPVPGQYNQAVR